jgi:hypothetical membrane protein
VKHRRKGLLAGLCWVLIIQYFVMLFVVQSRWTTPYSWLRNAISDLGATTCFLSAQVNAWVCSPWHVAASASWSVAGVCLAVGAILARRAFPATPTARVGLGLYLISGAALILVGLNPEDTNLVPHSIAAIIAIAAGEVAMLLTATALIRSGRWRPLGKIGIGSAIVAIIAFLLLITRAGGPTLFGLWERIAAFPVLLWPIACGVAMMIKSGRAQAEPARA